MSEPLPEDGLSTTPEGFTQLPGSAFGAFGFPAQVGPLYQKSGGEGGYVRAFRVTARHVNSMENAHGGMLMAFADMAFGHAVYVQRRTFWITVRLLCDFLGPAPIGSWVEGRGEILGVRGDLFNVRGRIWVDERTIMTGDGLFKAIGNRD